MKLNEKSLPAGGQGFSLVEMLVVICIFGILGIITTQIITLSVRSSGKSESIVKVREDLNHVMGVMERELRNASDVNCSEDSHTINYLNAANSWASFSCAGSAGNMYVASASAQITGNDINITNCSFACNPPLVTINLTAQNTNKTGVEAATVDISTQIDLRNY